MNPNNDLGDVMMAQPMLMDPVDTVELGELLKFLVGWLNQDGDCLADSFRRFVGNDGYGVEELQSDLDRFALLLGGESQ